MNKVEIAYAIAFTAHKGQFDKAGKEYIYHPLAVSQKFDEENAKIVALLHDVVEDTCITLDDLRLFFEDEIVETVDLLTHRDGEDYFAYLAKIKSNPLARAIKLADLEDNMDLSRFSHPCEQDYERLEKKYKPAYKFLLEN